jgi:hypothetical protein
MIEWVELGLIGLFIASFLAATVADILPEQRIQVKISSPSETERVLEIENWQGGAL